MFVPVRLSAHSKRVGTHPIDLMGKPILHVYSVFVFSSLGRRRQQRKGLCLGE